MDTQPADVAQRPLPGRPVPRAHQAGLMRRFISYGPAVLVAATACLTLIAGPEAIRQIQTAQTAAAISVAQQSLDEDSLLERLNQSVRSIATAVEPSVVYIESRSEDAPRRAGRSTGSGWVYDAQGHIVTNAHVIANSDRIRVNFYDGAVRDATFVGKDESSDIAVIKVEGAPGSLFPMRRATGEAVYQGDGVFAFGSPFGFKFSMSKGIVSGLGRDAVTSERRATRYSNFIQTDAAINPGNSGGPLVDVNGRVIGMNTAIITEVDTDALQDRQNTGVSMGIGFAIPLETIESVVSQLIGQGVVLRGFMGASLADVEQVERFRPELLKELAYERRTGVLVTGAPQGLPARKAGMVENDIITHVDGRATPNTVVLRSVIANKRPDATVRISVFRKGETLDVDVTLIAAQVNAAGDLQPVDREAALASRPREPFGELPELAADAPNADAVLGWMGIALREGDGVAIARVEQWSPAARSGLARGDVILAVSDGNVETKEQFFEAVVRAVHLPAEPSVVRLLVANPAGERRTVTLNLSRP